MGTALTPANPSLAISTLGPAVPWRTVVEAFLLAKVDSANTRRAYRRALVVAFERIGRPILADVTGLDLAAYRAALLKDGRSASTHVQALAALRSCLSWARLEHVQACPWLAK